MTVILPPQVIPGPEPRAARYGLFAAALGPNDLPNHAMAGGLTYESVSCGFSRIYPVACHTDRPQTVKVFTDGCDEYDEEGENGEEITALPFVVYATMKRGTAGHTRAELRTKVLRRLANGEQTSVEAGMANVLSTDPDLVTLTPPGITLADTVGELEQWLYGIQPTDQNYGYAGCLHCSPRIAAYAAEEDLIVQDGALLRTRMGTAWAFGGGYPDDGTIYISGQPTIWRSADVFVPDIAQTLDRGFNQYMLLAEREYAVAYDCLAAQAIYNWGVPT